MDDRSVRRSSIIRWHSLSWWSVQERPEVRRKNNLSSAEYQRWRKGEDIRYGTLVYGDGPLNVIRLSQSHG